MIITERRIAKQNWYESEHEKTGWSGHGWYFHDDVEDIDYSGFTVTEILATDKFGNPILAITEKQIRYEEGRLLPQ